MAARLGNVIYWAGCGAAALALFAWAAVYISPGEEASYWLPRYLVMAVGAWLLGRAARYVLAGR